MRCEAVTIEHRARRLRLQKRRLSPWLSQPCNLRASAPCQNPVTRALPPGDAPTNDEIFRGERQVKRRDRGGDWRAFPLAPGVGQPCSSGRDDACKGAGPDNRPSDQEIGNPGHLQHLHHRSDFTALTPGHLWQTMACSLLQMLPSTWAARHSSCLHIWPSVAVCAPPPEVLTTLRPRSCILSLSTFLEN